MVSLTIHDNTKIFIGDVCKKHETIAEGRANRSFYLGFGGVRQIEPSGGSFQCPSRELELNNFISKANDWRNRGRVVLDLFSKLEMGKIQKFLW